MSIQQRGNFNGQRLVSTTFDSIDSITKRFEDSAMEQHASIILDDRFWQELQDTLTHAVCQKRQMLTAGGYTDAARQLRTVENLAIRTAIEDFRATVLEVPERIHSHNEWNQFRARIRHHTHRTDL